MTDRLSDVSWPILQHSGGWADHDSFVAGLLCGAVAVALSAGATSREYEITESVVDQLDLISMAMGYTMLVRRHDDSVYAKFTKAEDL